MKNYWHIIIILFITHSHAAQEKIATSISTHPKFAITYKLNKGRLGDHLLTYLKAKYLSIRYHLTLLYKPFIHSSFFSFDQNEMQYTTELEELYERIVPINTIDDFHPKLANTLYVSHLQSKIKKNQNNTFSNEAIKVYLDFVKNNQRFAQFVYQGMRPNMKITPIKPPSRDTLNIAVHVRKGDGYDAPLLSQQYDNPKIIVPVIVYDGADLDYHSDVRHPTRFPREQYYVNQILLLSKLYPDKNMYVHIFTDSHAPNKIAQRFLRALQLPPSKITISFQKYVDNSPTHIIEDLFNMLNFDYLIRPASSFSKIAQIAGNFKLTIAPHHYFWNKNVLIIDKIQITYYKNKNAKYYIMPSYNNNAQIAEFKNILSSRSWSRP